MQVKKTSCGADNGVKGTLRELIVASRCPGTFAGISNSVPQQKGYIQS
jgi:hypothetical protein